MTRESHAVDRLLEPIATTEWTGPDENPRVEQRIKETRMKSNKFGIGRTGIALIVLGAVGGGALATAVTQQILAQRATLVTEDGRTYDAVLVPEGEKSSASFITEDGTVYNLDLLTDVTGERQVTVDLSGDQDAEGTIIIEEVDD